MPEPNHSIPALYLMLILAIIGLTIFWSLVALIPGTDRILDFFEL